MLTKAKRLDPLDPEIPLFLSKCLSDRVFEPQVKQGRGLALERVK